VGSLSRLALAAALVAALLAPGADAQARTPGTLVTMHTTGGFAGIDHLLTVGRRRHARIDSRGTTRRFVVSRNTMHRLRAALSASHWLQLRAEYPAEQPVADGSQYAVTHRGHEVRSEDGAKRPKRLNRVLRELERIVGRHGGFT
jgi:hypothetical protein